MNVKLTPAQRIRVQNSAGLYKVMREVLLRDNALDRGKEHFWVVGLAANSTLLYVELVSLGSYRATVVEPMDVFRWALQKDSRQLVLVHNHPGGGLQPSVHDVEVTAQLYQVGELLDLPVIDHLIITGTGYYSFVDGGLMDELRQTKKYLLNDAAQARLKAEAEQIGEAKGREAERLAVAAALKSQGVEASIIAKATGLSVAKVRGLGVGKGKGSGAKAGR